MPVEVMEVTKLYGNQKAVDAVSFTVSRGEIAGFLGPNGAGKTTLMKIITGFMPPTSGKVLIDNTEVSVNDPEIKRRIGYLPENNPLYPEMYVKEYLSFIASVYRMGRESRKAVEKVIEITGLAPERNKKIGALSKGYRQRVGLAHALIHNPDILILDEATSGLDPNQIVEIRNLIREAGREKTVIMSTHIMQEVEAVCSRVIIIDKGRIIADEPIGRISGLLSAKRQVVNVEFDRDPGETELYGIPGVNKVVKTAENRWQIESASGSDIRPALFSFAVSRNITVLSLSQEESSLEEIFRSLTG